MQVERHPVRRCSAPQMSRGAPHHLRQIHQQQQNAAQKQQQRQGWAQQPARHARGQQPNTHLSSKGTLSPASLPP